VNCQSFLLPVFCKLRGGMTMLQRTASLDSVHQLRSRVLALCPLWHCVIMLILPQSASAAGNPTSLQPYGGSTTSMQPVQMLPVGSGAPLQAMVTIEQALDQTLLTGPRAAAARSLTCCGSRITNDDARTRTIDRKAGGSRAKAILNGRRAKTRYVQSRLSSCPS
jgi:hypothetical protein